MKIAEKHVVTLNYTLKDNDDNIIDQSEDGSFCYLHGASNIIPGLENALAGKSSGDELSVSVAPEEGYGPRDDARIQEVPRDAFPPEPTIEAGMQFNAEGPDGQAVMVTIAKVEGDTVTVDGNHPLAGITLNFAVSIADVREASAEELEHGHVHGPDGHQHD
ncbi:MAG: peptidylprolyl isomerase [Gammaproteobacteria bacterium]|nr:MAG: peptidylprolyl isomerase [Gammaproteobacteria bacterium]